MRKWSSSPGYQQQQRVIPAQRITNPSWANDKYNTSIPFRNGLPSSWNFWGFPYVLSTIFEGLMVDGCLVNSPTNLQPCGAFFPHSIAPAFLWLITITIKEPFLRNVWMLQNRSSYGYTYGQIHNSYPSHKNLQICFCDLRCATLASSPGFMWSSSIGHLAAKGLHLWFLFAKHLRPGGNQPSP